MSTDTPVEVPLVERLRRIPKAHKVSIAFQFADNGTATGHSIIPVGYLMHTAADELARLREELAEAKRTETELRRVIERGRTSTDTELLLSKQLEEQRSGNIKLMQQAEQTKKELAEAKREIEGLQKAIDDNWITHQRIVAAEARALAAEKDAGRYIDKWSHGCHALCAEIDLWIKNCPHCGKPAIDAAIKGSQA